MYLNKQVQLSPHNQQGSTYSGSVLFIFKGQAVGLSIEPIILSEI